MADYYSILGVAKNATADEIKKAYRKLASQHHPDRGGDTAKFQEIQAAYDTLSNPDKRSQYDNPRPQVDGFHQYGGMPPGFEDMVSQMFGGGFGDIFGRRPQPVKNKNINLQTQISLEDAFRGKDLLSSIQLPSGREQLLEVKIPAGIRSGTTLRLAGMGDDRIPNVPRGDIYLSVDIMPHRTFQRDGDDLRIKVNVSCFDAILGKSIQFETIDGTLLETAIPSGIQHGQTLNAQGYGMPSLSNPLMRGRLLIDINITIPLLTDDQKEALKKIIN
jgi:curved DNA-binding protein